VDLCQPDEWVEQAERLLAPEERAQAERGVPDVRLRRLVGRAALRIALGRELDRAPASLRFTTGPHGKPALEDGDVHFSTSASADDCLIAITGLGPLGVDVEHVVPRRELDRIAATRFASREAESIARLDGDRRLRAFYRCWTVKEAYLKARGIGLSIPLDRVVVSVDEGPPAIVALDGDDPSAWSVEAFEPGPELVGALAVRTGGAPAPGPSRVRPLPLVLD